MHRIRTASGDYRVLKICGRNYHLVAIHGVAYGTNKPQNLVQWTEHRTVGGGTSRGGYFTASVPVERSRIATNTQIFLRADDGRDFAFTFPESDLAIADGHRVSVVMLVDPRNGRRWDLGCLNHTVDQFWHVGNYKESAKSLMTGRRWLIRLGYGLVAALTYVVTGALVAGPNPGPPAFWAAVGAMVAGGLVNSGAHGSLAWRLKREVAAEIQALRAEPHCVVPEAALALA